MLLRDVLVHGGSWLTGRFSSLIRGLILGAVYGTDSGNGSRVRQTSAATVRRTAPQAPHRLRFDIELEPRLASCREHGPLRPASAATGAQEPPRSAPRLDECAGRSRAGGSRVHRCVPDWQCGGRARAVRGLRGRVPHVRDVVPAGGGGMSFLNDGSRGHRSRGRPWGTESVPWNPAPLFGWRSSRWMRVFR